MKTLHYEGKFAQLCNIWESFRVSMEFSNLPFHTRQMTDKLDFIYISFEGETNVFYSLLEVV